LQRIEASDIRAESVRDIYSMAKIAASNRAPRGTKNLAQAFFAAADEIPESSRAAVVKAALAAIREELKDNRARASAAKAKAKGRAAPVKGRKAAGRPKAAAKAGRRASSAKAKTARNAAPAKAKRASVKRGRKATRKSAPKQEQTREQPQVDENTATEAEASEM
jgi:hypothetical protein